MRHDSGITRNRDNAQLQRREGENPSIGDYNLVSQERASAVGMCALVVKS